MTKSDIRPVTVLIIALTLVAQAVFGQDIQLTPEQMQLLNQLPEQQRQELIKKYLEGSTTGVVSKDVIFPELVSPAQDEEAVKGLSGDTILISELKTFGQDLFEGVPNTFAPATDVPVPPDYVLGPGDTIQVQFYGKENATYSFEITRDGILNLPELGPVSVIGLGFDEFRRELQDRVANTLIGTNVSISMGQLRSIRVFVLGDVNRPGSYTVSGLSTMTHALFVSGGISPVGTMRSVQLKREGRVVQTLDLYDLLLKGDTSKDSRLMQGDVLFIPTVGRTVGVDGAVKRPAIYELRDEETVADVMSLAGGLNSSAYAAGAKLERIATDNKRVVVQVNLADKGGMAYPVTDGDRLMVPYVLDKVYRQVSLNGHVYRPGSYAWFEGMRLTDLIPSSELLKNQADVHYVLVRRELASALEISVFSADLGEAWREPGGDEDVVLMSRDQVFVFSLGDGRQEITGRLLDELKAQARVGEFNAQVSVDGQVRAPGTYPLEPGMRISDVIRAAGDLSESAYAVEAELVRFNLSENAVRESEVLSVDIGAVLAGSAAADIALQPYDRLHIKVIPEWRDQSVVSLEGEFRFPGKYTLRVGETLGSVLSRAGGLTEQAFPEGAIFLREELKEREQQSIRDVTERLRSDIAALALEGAASGQGELTETITMGNSLLAQLETAEATGRLVLPFNQLVSGTVDDSIRDLQMQDGDRILMPGKRFEVTVIGEVQQPTSHLYAAGISRDQYIAKSGGLTRKADKKRIYVVRASGDVVGISRSKWLGRRGDIQLRPGDTIVVPLNADKMRPMAFWTGVTQILYQGAISVAAVKTFNR